ncbi:MAG TPA: hypothetical protein VFI73_07990 [Candidatus Nitrosopolaris sp.]|nr:hypothetical protein [Candidatus Nitrosopolaris sp.]
MPSVNVLAAMARIRSNTDTEVPHTEMSLNNIVTSSVSTRDVLLTILGSVGNVKISRWADS